MKKIKNLLLTLSMSLAMLLPAFAVPVVAYAATDIPGSLNCGTQSDVTRTDCPSDPSAGNKINNIVSDVINIFSVIVGVTAVIMIIVGGVKYVTSGGESNNITSAKNTILYAIVGLVIVALAQVLVRYVLNRVSNSTGP